MATSTTDPNLKYPPVPFNMFLWSTYSVFSNKAKGSGRHAYQHMSPALQLHGMSEMQGEIEEACGLETEGNPDWSQETCWPGASSLSLQRQRARLQNGEGRGGLPKALFRSGCGSVAGGTGCLVRLQGQREPSKSPPGKGWVRKVIVRDTGAGPEKPREQEVGGSSLALDSLCAPHSSFLSANVFAFSAPS